MIRFTQPTDCEMLLDIDIKCYDKVWLANEFLATDTYVYIIDKRIVAFVSWRTNGGTLQIIKLGVTPAFRRQGIGSTMIDAVLCRGLITRCLVSEDWLSAQLFLKDNQFKWVNTTIKRNTALYTMENKNGIDNLAGSYFDECFGVDGPDVDRHGPSDGPEAAGIYT